MFASLFWNETALEANRVDHSHVDTGLREAAGPVHSARALAIVHAAMADAYACAHRAEGGNPPFTARFVSKAPPGPVDPAAALAGAAHAALRGLYARQAAYFDNRMEEYLAGRADAEAEAVTTGLVFGASVGHAMLDARAHDGVDDTGPYTPGGLPGMHDVDPLNPRQGFYGPRLGLMAPFVLKPSEIATAMPPPPPGLADARYLDHYAEVYGKGARDGGTRTEDETEVGLFWAYDGARNIGTPPRLYNQVVRQIGACESPAWGEAEWVAVLAQINLAMADAGIVSWRAKYLYNVWRPVLGVRHHVGQPDCLDAPQDPIWEPLGAPQSNAVAGSMDFTPPFPAYPSGHATFGAACFTALKAFRGAQGVEHPDALDVDLVSEELNGITRDARGHVRPAVVRHYGSIDQMIVENLESRVFLGVHWRFDGDGGRHSGEMIGAWVADRVYQLAPALVPAA